MLRFFDANRVIYLSIIRVIYNIYHFIRFIIILKLCDWPIIYMYVCKLYYGYNLF